MTETRKVDVKPFEGFVLVHPIKQNTTESGFSIAGTTINPNRATVVAVPKVISLNLKPGDTVLVNDYVDKPYKIDTESYFFVKLEDILGVEV